MSNELIHSDEITDTYRTAMGIVTVWKKDGKDQNGVKGKEGTSNMVYSGPEPIKMTLKRKYTGG
tara:strand:+ start:3181 stop:3372 length:192 start_codon:yes stop_codon:yes gene_type:complete